MVFSSITFLFYFFPIFFGIYYILPRILRNWWILIASCVFYAWGAPKFILILIASSLIDFYLVRSIHSITKKSTRRALLTISLVKNVGILLYYKYANFFIENVNSALTGLGYEGVSTLDVILPIGISFYTFQTITYAMDVYSGKHAPLKHPHELLLYILSFPQMIAGPIVQFNTVADQITNRSENADKFLYGFYRFSIGLGKKVLIANTVGAIASEMLAIPLPNASEAWLGIIAYTFQIYFDFSGYSDMAIGLGKMMGFDFPENFDNPYTSKSITEFWRRWHITLGAWMRQYLYIPLGGNRVDNKRRLYMNLWIVFLISGLWHGASWNYVVWGAYHGFFLVVERIFLLDFLKRIGKWGAWLWTFLIVVIGWVFFSIEETDHIWTYLHALFDFGSFSSIEIDPRTITMLILAGLFSTLRLFSTGQTLELRAFEESIGIRSVLVRYVLSLILILVSVGAITGEGFNPFIYFRF